MSANIYESVVVWGGQITWELRTDIPAGGSNTANSRIITNHSVSTATHGKRDKRTYLQVRNDMNQVTYSKWTEYYPYSTIYVNNKRTITSDSIYGDYSTKLP